MEKYVVSLEIAKELKWPWETEFYWEWFTDIKALSKREIVRRKDRTPPHETDCLVYFPAPFTDEMLERLPDIFKGGNFIVEPITVCESEDKPEPCWREWHVGYHHVPNAGSVEKKLSDALARLWMEVNKK